MTVRILRYVLLIFVTGSLGAQHELPVLVESELPVFMASDVSAEKARLTWETSRRQQILEAFETHVYGKAPDSGYELHIKPMESKSLEPVLSLERKRISIRIKTSKGNAEIKLTLLLPLERTRPIPVFLGMHLFDASRDLPVIGQPWEDPNDASSPLASKDPAFLLHLISHRGYGVATIDANDVDPDEHDGFKNGVHALFHDASNPHGPEDWGTLSTWAWGLSRALDAMEQMDEVDVTKVIVIGHSRMGKTALWAGAVDTRFAMVISNDSGCGGAAISRRRKGETVAHINRVFPHWFCGNFHAFGDLETDLPVDQHMLVALAAPRPVYIASAKEDDWADPMGEFLSAYYASEVYEFYGLKGVGKEERPILNQSIGDKVGYHIRSGRHDITSYDWAKYLDFADRHLVEK